MATPTQAGRPAGVTTAPADGTRIDQVLSRAAERAPDRTAIRSGTEQYSYAELDGWTDRCASLVRELTGDSPAVVAVAGIMDPAFAALFFGISRAGSVSAIVNPYLPADRLAHVLATSGARLAVLTPQMHRRLREVRERVSTLDTVVLTGPDEEPDPAGEELPTLRALLDTVTAEPITVPAERDAVACLQFTSGTTGAAKAVRLSHHNLTVNAAQTVSVHRLDETAVVFNCLPTFHLMHLTMAATAAAVHVLWPEDDPVASIEAADRLRATHYYSLPLRLSRLATDRRLTRLEAPALRAIFSGGSSLPVSASLALAQQFGVPVVQGYGLAETSPSMHLGSPERPKAGSCGQVVPGGESRIVDIGSGSELPPGSRGEIQVRGPQLMLGYLGRDLSQDVDADGWFSTGDVGYLDDEGFLFWVDRIKDTFKCDNWLVSPTEIERVLLKHPAVTDCVVFDLPDEFRGAVACAMVVTGADPAEIAKTVNRGLPYYEQLSRIEVVDAIPRSPTGKVERRRLRDRLLGRADA